MVRLHSRHVFALPVIIMVAFIISSNLWSSTDISIRTDHSDVMSLMRKSREESLPPVRNNEKVNASTVTKLQEILEMNRENRTECGRIIDGDGVLSISAGFLVKDLIETANQDERERVSALIRRLAMKGCKSVIKDYGFILDHLTEEERDFPIAYSLIIHDHFDMFIKLMAAIYRPQNFYCLHLDSDAQPAYHMMVRHFSECFHNVQAPNAKINVEWGKWSVVQAEMRCMEVLYKKKDWKYLINLSSQDFPLKTNFELVQILKSYRGANDVFGSHIIKRPRRWATVNHSIPRDLTPVTGHNHIAVNRQFVEFVLFSNESKAIQKFMQSAVIPDEVFFPTINHNTHFGIHGSFRGLHEVEAEVGRKPSFTRFKYWYTDSCYIRPEAGGVCYLGVGELYLLTHSPAMFATKFKLSLDPLVVGCLSQWFANKTLGYYTGQLTFDTSPYASSVIVKNMVQGNRSDTGWY